MSARSAPAVVILVAAACLGSPGAGVGSFVCDYDPREIIGTIQADQAPYLDEASGLVHSRAEPDVFWSHQDNPNDERIFAIRRDGTYLGTWDFDMADAVEPEDIAIGPGPAASTDYVYLGDIGSDLGIWGCTTPNSDTGQCAGCPTGESCEQRDLLVWRAIEPTVDPAQPSAPVINYPSDTITLQFPDAQMLGRRQDSETLMVDPQTGDIYVVTARTTPGMVFRAPFPQSTTDPIVMEFVSDLPLGETDGAKGGDISTDGRLIIVRTAGEGYIWERQDGTSLADALAGTACVRTDLTELDGQAVAFDVDSSGTFYTTGEASGASTVPIHRYRNVDAPCILDSDCSDNAFCNGAEICGADNLCQDGVPPTCPGQLCSDALGQCVDCLGDADCSAGDTCDVDQGLCLPVVPADPLPIETGDTWYYFKGTVEPPADWTSIDFDDSSWLNGPGGFGYGPDCSALHGTVLSDMSGSYGSLYLRVPFTVENAAAVVSLTLTMDYDDAFVAYLNGQEVARSNVIGNPPSHTQPATGNRGCSGAVPAGAIEDYDLTTTPLVDGLNVLALQGHNDLLSSENFSIIAALAATTVATCAIDDDCDDGLFCNGPEVCSSGLCEPGNSPACDDGVACTTDVCNEETDSCDNTVNDDACDDGLFCNGTETCDAANDCQAGIDVVCEDGVACTTDSCNEATDSCDFSPDDTACDDGTFCNGAETCDAVNGCQAGIDVVCDDDVACTTDSCNETTDSCDALPDDSACDDGIFCDGAEVCNPSTGCEEAATLPCPGTTCLEDLDQCGQCLSDATCDDGFFCNGVEACVGGLCQPPSGNPCFDGVECTIDVCLEFLSTCVNAPDGALCDDGQFCNGRETCDVELGCLSLEPPCPAEECEETTDRCLGCEVDADCNDGLFCNGVETCPAGLCVDGTPIACDDGIACTDDACDEGTLSCVSTANNLNCDDGLFCNGFETCDAFADCQAGTRPCFDCEETADICEGDGAIWMALTNNTALPGIGAIADEDVVAYDEATGLWSLIFDGSDVGLASRRLSGLAALPGGDLLLSFTSPVLLPDLAVDDSDVVRFTPSSLGSTTAGTFSMYFDGSDVGLTQSAEKLDAIGLTIDGRLIVSTSGSFEGGGAAGDDKDLYVFNHTTLGVNTAGTFEILVDGADVGLDNNGEDIDAVSLTASGNLLISTTGNFVIGPLSGADEDILEFMPTMTGDPTVGTFDVRLDLTTLGISSGKDLLGVFANDFAPNCSDGLQNQGEDRIDCGGPCAACACTGDGDCDNDLFCDGAESCDAFGICQSGTPVVCDDDVDCTVDACNEDTDSCDNTPDDSFCDDGVACTVDSCNAGTNSCDNVPSDSLCDNGDFCDGEETCDVFNDCQAGSDPCPDGSCDDASDVCGPCITNADCDDGLFCNGSEVCNAGTCEAGTPPTCDDGVACTIDTCNETVDGCDSTPSDALCDNGDFCDGAETCDGVSGCQAGTPPNCDDGVACTVDACNEDTDSCDNVTNHALCDDGLFCNGVETCDPVNDCQSGPDPCGSGNCDEAADQCDEIQIWMSFRSNTAVPGVGVVANEDAVIYSETTGLWSLIFDGSDVGLSAREIDGLAVLPDGDLLLNLNAPTTLPGAIIVDDSDIVRFTPTSLGATTAGTFSIYFDGSDVGLTVADEDLDGIGLTADGRLILSTEGSIVAPGATGLDEDMWIFNDTSLGPDTAGLFEMLFDGSDVGLSDSSSEEVDALAMTSAGDIVFSTFGNFAVDGLSGVDEDIMVFTPTQTGGTTAGSFAVRLDLTALGINGSEDVGSVFVIE